MLDIFLVVLLISVVTLYCGWSVYRLFFSKNGGSSCCSPRKKSSGCEGCSKALDNV